MRVKNIIVQYLPFFAAAIIYTNLLQAQKHSAITFERISTDMIRYEKGLSQNTVQCMMQDRFGFMWFGTWDGLNKYDGYTFTVWNEENGLSNQNIQALLEDREGLIWIGTEDGLNVYDRSKDKITIYRNDHRTENSIVHNRIRSLCLDRNGDIWIGTNRGISVFRKKLNRFENYKHDINSSGSLINNWVNKVFCDDAGNIWIGTYRGLEKFDQLKKRFIHFNRSTGWDMIAMQSVYSITQDSTKNLWIGTPTGIFRIDSGKDFCQKIELLNIPQNGNGEITVSNMLFDEMGHLWIGTTRHGIIAYNPVNNEAVLLRNEKENHLSLSSDQVYSLFADEAGVIWIGTFSGLNKYDRNSSKFRHYRQTSDNSQSLLSDVIFSFFEDEDGIIWIGTDKGISLFRSQDQTYSLLKNSKGINTPLIQGLVRTFLKDREGNIWIGSSGGLTRYDPVNARLKQYVSAGAPGNSLVNNYVRKIVEDHSGMLWIATEMGLSRFDKKREVFINYQNEDNNNYSLPDNNVFDLHVDRDGRLWVATGGGFCWYDHVRQRFYQAVNDSENLLTDNQKRIAGIYEAPDGIFWLGTMGGGLMRLDFRTGKYKFYIERDGLPNNVVYKVVDDMTGNLWVPTNRGLARFNIANESFVTYGVKDGVQSNEFNLGAAYRTRDGRIFLGGMNGFNSFYPDEIRKNTKPARIAVTGFYIFDKLMKRELFDGDTIRLKYSENFFAFSFSALDFANPSKNQYKYYLQNFEKGWVTTDAYNRSAGYTNVPPGRYVFRIKGSNNDGIWNDKGICVTLIIVPPWYATWAFRFGGGAGAAVLIFFVVMMRIRQMQRKHRVEKQFLKMERQYSDLEQKALRLQMNPHFIFNTLNSIQSYMISNESEKAVDFLAKFARLMRQVLANSRESFIPVKEEITALEYYLEIEQLRFEDKFKYEIIIDSAIDDDFTGIPPMVIQPYVENAIIHGLLYKEGKGRVTISLELRPDYIFCVVEDNGVGRTKAFEMARESGLERKSSGMIITRQRLEILNRNEGDELKVVVVDKTDNEGLPSGTRVEIKMPFINI